MPITAYGTEIAASIPSALVGGAALQAAKIGNKIAQAGLMGAGYGTGTAEEVSDIPVSAGLGAAAGAGLQKLTPSITAGAKELIQRGVPVTIGQAIGSGAKRAEEAATSVPFLGDVIRSGQRRAFERFGVAAYNEALEPIGKKIPKNLTGREAYQAAEKQISDAYDDVIKMIDIPAGQAFVQNVSGVIGKYAQDLPEREAKQLSAIVQREITNRIQGGRLTKQAFKDAQSGIRGDAYTFSTSTDAYQKKLGDALNDVAGELFEVLAKEAPELSTQLKNVDTAYSRFVPLQKAAAKAGEGVFSPAQLRTQIVLAAEELPAAMASELPMLKLAETAQDVLGVTVPETGSATRGLTGMGILGGLGAGAGMPLEAMALGGVTSGLYTRPVQALLRGSMPYATRFAQTPATAGLIGQEVEDIYTTPEGRQYGITGGGTSYSLLGE